MSPDERRKAILEAALPLLREHGKSLTTRQIAEAAGIAEGTIFRVFASKEELFDAAFDCAFDPAGMLDELEAIDRDQPVRGRLVDLATLFQRRFLDIFTLMAALGMRKPPERHRHDEDEWRERANSLTTGLLASDADAFRLPVDDVVRILRLLTFSGSHPHISDNRLMTPDEIVDVVLHGTLTKES
jgi:AcrR family transcriptional regulator